MNKGSNFFLVKDQMESKRNVLLIVLNFFYSCNNIKSKIDMNNYREIKDEMNDYNTFKKIGDMLDDNELLKLYMEIMTLYNKAIEMYDKLKENNKIVNY